MAHARLHGPLLLFLRLPRVHHHQFSTDIRGQVEAGAESQRSDRAHGLLPRAALRDASQRYISGK